MDVRQRDRDDDLDTALPANRAPEFRHNDTLARVQSVWLPDTGAGQLIGAALFLGGLAVLLVGWSRAGASDGTLRGLWFLTAVAATASTVYIAVLVVRLRTISYRLEASELVVSAVGLRLAARYEDIVDVVFRPRDLIQARRYERHWPGFYDSQRLTSEGDWRSIATNAPAERVRVRLRSGSTIAISPARPVLFVEALEEYRRSWAVQAARVRREYAVELPPTPEEPEVPEPTLPYQPAGLEARPQRRAEPAWSRLRWPLAVRLFRDRIVRDDRVASNLLALNLIALIVLIAIASWRSDAVNSPLPVHWDANGEPTWFVRPDGFWVFEGIWIYPVTAAAVIAVNSALATLAAAADRLAESRMLLSGSFVVTLLLLIGLWRTTGATLPVLG